MLVASDRYVYDPYGKLEGTGLSLVAGAPPFRFRVLQRYVKEGCYITVGLAVIVGNVAGSQIGEDVYRKHSRNE